jgi:hypothetical protein
MKSVGGKPIIAGLTILGLMLQACLVVLRFSMLISPLISPTTRAVETALNVARTHGAVVPTPNGTPNDWRSDCAHALEIGPIWAAFRD